jgi:type I restriction enzyme R subunit
MTEFKQIIGRGSRINEEYGKRYFTIIDFRNVTDLFADPAFDGDPVRIKPVTQDEDISSTEQEEEEDHTPVVEIVGEEETVIEFSTPEYLPGQTSVPPPLEEKEPREKIFVNGIDVTVLNTRELYFDNEGRPITESLKDYTKKQILKDYRSLDDFLRKWNAADRKEAIVAELEEHGVLVDDLINAVDRQCDLFDIISHVAFDQPPLTRRERANNVIKRNYFTKYGELARKVIEALLDKYADEGITNIENIEVLKVKPLTDFGSAVEIIKTFGGKTKYLEAIKELERQLYKAA